MLLVYAKTGTGIARAMKQHLSGRSKRTCIETYSNLDDLLYRLRQPRLNLKIGVLSIGSAVELDQLVSIRELLADMRLVVVLPDNHPQTLSKVHAIGPRFITFAGAGLASLVSVVEKMMGSQIGYMIPSQSTMEASHL